MSIVKRICTLILSSAMIICFTPYNAEADNEAAVHEGYALMELTTGTVIAENNSDKAVPIGTMNKLMTTLLVAEKINEGVLSPEDMIKTSNAANSMQGAQIWLMPGEEMSLSDLLKGIIIGNANDASVSAAEAVSGNEKAFVELMNTRAEEIGMKNTAFTNCCGYYDCEKQTSSAYDIAVLCRELYKYEFLRDYFTCRLDYLRGEDTELVSSNKLIGNYEGLIGFKAGFTEKSGNCIAAAAERNGCVYAAVLVGYEDKDIMFSEAKRLLNKGFAEYTVIFPDIPDNIPDELPVKLGCENSVGIDYIDPTGVVLPKQAAYELSSYVIVPEYINAPVKKGEVVGEIHFYRNDKFLYSIDLRSKNSVDKLDTVKSIGILLKFLISF